MKKKPSRPSKKKSPKYPKGPDLAQLLDRHPEVQAMLKPLHLAIEVKSGRVLGRLLWLCP